MLGRQKRYFMILLAIFLALAAVLCAVWFLFPSDKDRGGGEDTQATKGLAIDANEAALLSGNLSNGSFAVEVGGYIWYFDPEKGQLMRGKNDLTEASVMDARRSFFLCPADEWIYYVSERDDTGGKSSGNEIMRVNADGTGKARVFGTDGIVCGFYVTADAIYLSESGGASGLYRYDLALKEKTLLRAGNIGVINLEKDTIYFHETDAAGEKGAVWRMRTDGTEERCVTSGSGDQSVRFFTTGGDFIYYTDQRRTLYRARKSGGKPQPMGTGDVSSVNPSGELIYYLDIRKAGRVEGEEEGASPGGDVCERLLFLDPKDGTQTVVSEELLPGTPINLAGGKLWYFEGSREGNSTHPILFRMNPDGTEKEAISAGADTEEKGWEAK